jgi:hemerythrin
MSLIIWQEEFRTGIPGVDYEHEKLIEQINSIFALIDGKADREEVLDGLGDIYGAISAHFSLEERMMERYAYGNYCEHKADHERLLDSIRDIADEFESTIELDDEMFKQKLNDWFQAHFKTHDSRLHKLLDLMSHDRVDESIVKKMIRDAKNILLGRTS